MPFKHIIIIVLLSLHLVSSSYQDNFGFGMGFLLPFGVIFLVSMQFDISDDTRSNPPKSLKKIIINTLC